MAALSLHHALFTNEKDSDLPLRSAASFLHPAPERDGSPTSQLFASAAYQDLIQRQPTHPDGPTSGWDLGLDLLGDPITAAEHKSLEDHQTKMKLRHLRIINIAFELLFGMLFTFTFWGAISYTYVLRYLGNVHYYSLLPRIPTCMCPRPRDCICTCSRSCDHFHFDAIVSPNSPSSLVVHEVAPSSMLSTTAGCVCRGELRSCLDVASQSALQLGHRYFMVYICCEYNNLSVSYNTICCVDNCCNTATCSDVDDDREFVRDRI